MEEHECERERDRDNPWVRVPGRKSISSKSLFSVFAANLTFDTTAEDLLRIFGRFGKIRDVFLPWNRQLHRSREFAFIRFYYEQDAHNAIQCLHERRIDGRVAHIAWAKSQSGTRVTIPSTSYPEYQQRKSNMARPFLDAATRSTPGTKNLL
ncbi:serine/arginine-rich splicing factor SC35-like [Magnolia sinica]|uniref:serine/arginine-rich splicing factor SC35-like n=1 Tax=Magnolia sinica TaxID=86752 RepID=UPI0026598B54|nr:serine/arginine-rich splicing factor SC35-like [Magnolia sinica]